MLNDRASATAAVRPTRCHGVLLQVVAVMYLCLTALIQLNLLATRNPSFLWRLKSKFEIE